VNEQLVTQRIESQAALKVVNEQLVAQRIESQAALKAVNEQLVAERVEAQAALQAANEEIAALRAEVQAALQAGRDRMLLLYKNIGALESRYNRYLEMQQQSIQANIDVIRVRLANIVGMNTFRYMMKILQRYGRLRGLTIGFPTLPERIVVKLEKIDLSAAYVPSENAKGTGTSIGRAEPLASIGIQSRVQQLPAIGREGPCVLMQVASLDRGGLEQVVYDLACGLQARGKRVVILAIERGGEIADRLLESGVEVVTLGGFTPKAYEEAIAKLDVEAAIIHHSYEGLDLLHAHGAPIIEVVHNYYHWQQSRPNDYLAKSKVVAKRVAVSNGVADFHAAAFALPRGDIEVIWNPINSHGFIRPERKLLMRARRNWRKEFVFINVAQFYPAKAQAGLITAFEKIYRRHPYTRLRLVGDFVDAEVENQILAQIEKAGLQSAIDMPGFVGRRALSQMYVTSHVFVQPSVYEGFSVAMAEAAHFALPMILTRVGGAADIIKDNDCGILIPPHFDSLIGVSEREIFDSGKNPMPANLPALVDAMENMIAEYDSWMMRGFTAQDRIDRITIDDTAGRYLSLVKKNSLGGQLG